jgi:dissimilatory sulfite reductase (desulfoviridin) alpha/beta subunit
MVQKMSRKSSDFFIEQQVLLGGKASHKYPYFKDIARRSPDYAEIIFLIQNFEKWEKETSDEKVMIEILDFLGMCEFVRFTDELSRLSMIIGDEREHTEVGAVMSELRKSRSNSTT